MTDYDLKGIVGSESTDFDTLEVTITYTDESTETRELYVVPAAEE